jgi:4'-phosphopantetheinyl transferase
MQPSDEQPPSGSAIGAADDDIVVTYTLTDALSDDAVRAAVARLSEEERARHDLYVSARDRRDFAVAHALLRRALSARGGLALPEWTFVAGAHGKPALAPVHKGRAALSFNLAHTDGLVACIVGRDADLGIDVETIDRRIDPLALASRFFSPTEAAALEQCDVGDRQARFIETWTLKEAYVKAIGEGLSCPLRSFAFVYDAPASVRFEAGPHVPAASWRFALLAPTARHRMAIAIRGRSTYARRIAIAADGHGGDDVAADRPIRVSSPSGAS